MILVEESASPSRGVSALLWILRIPIALLFLFAAAMKLSGQPMMVADFDRIGLGQAFRYVTGLVELVGAVALLAPRFSARGAVVLLLVDIGAFVVQITSLHEGWLHTVVLGVPLAVLIWLQRGTLRRR